MRKPRILGRSSVNYYHLMSRVVSGDFLLKGEEEKTFFRNTMRGLEAFMGVKVLTYCIMSNHFHILAEVPEVKDLPDEELLRRIQGFYKGIHARLRVKEYEEIKKEADETGDDRRLKAWRKRYLDRMGRLSIFGKELKERFTRWYNWRNNREGAFWSARFKSVLVENSESALSIMAAYIDLNPVRAKIVTDPKDYRFCGYGEAVAGGKSAQTGICSWAQMDRRDRKKVSWSVASAMYRTHLFVEGDGKGIDPEEVKRVLDAGGKLSTKELLQCRVRYFSNGLVFGGKRFVEHAFKSHRSWFSEKRTSGAREIKGAEDSFFCLRDLRKEAIRPPDF